MADYKKLKTEVYEMTGGINTKASPYVNSPNEFRSIVNMNFSTPGALTKRPGSTNYVGTTFVGATTTSQILGGAHFESSKNNYYAIVFADRNNLYTSDTNFPSNTYPTLFPNGISNLIATGLSTPTDSVLSFISYADRIFYANGLRFRRTGGFGCGVSLGASISIDVDTQQLFGDYRNTLPYPLTIGTEISGTYLIGGGSLIGVRYATFISSFGNLLTDFVPYDQAHHTAIEDGKPPFIPGLSGYHSFSFAFEDELGNIGPVGAAFGGSIFFNGITFNCVKIYANLNAYSSFQDAIAGGAKYLDIFRSLSDGKTRFLAAKFPLKDYLYHIGLSGADPTYQVYFNDPYEGTQDLALTLPEPSSMNMQDSWPRYLEIYNNQLFVAGTKGGIVTYSDFGNETGRYIYPPTTDVLNQSTILWSDIGAPTQFSPENFAEVRTSDGDRITGLKAYAGSLIITKERSFHRLSGSDPTNFLLQEVSAQYGCLSNQAMVVWENKLWFLDQKGICEYNGANIQIVSNKVQPIFDAMNIAAAREFACAIHYKQQNEVWFAIPTDGASYNNTIVVFDYLTNVWTVYKGLNPSAMFNADGVLSYHRPFLTGYTGSLRYMDPALYSDAGAGITCQIETRFLADSGQTTERQYRRFYLNVDPAGTSQAISVDFRTNFGSSIMLSRTMYQSPFQSRIDFGLSARSIQAIISHYSATLPFKVNGFSFESRYQRAV